MADEGGEGLVASARIEESNLVKIIPVIEDIISDD